MMPDATTASSFHRKYLQRELACWKVHVYFREIKTGIKTGRQRGKNWASKSSSRTTHHLGNIELKQCPAVILSSVFYLLSLALRATLFKEHNLPPDSLAPPLHISEVEHDRIEIRHLCGFPSSVVSIGMWSMRREEEYQMSVWKLKHLVGTMFKLFGVGLEFILYVSRLIPNPSENDKSAVFLTDGREKNRTKRLAPN